VSLLDEDLTFLTRVILRHEMRETVVLHGVHRLSRKLRCRS